MLQKLIRFLPVAEKVIARKTTLPILKYVCIHDGYISATDLENTVLMKVDDTRDYTLPLTILKTVLKAKPKVLKIDVLENEKVQIQYDSRKLTLNSINAEEFPQNPSGRFKSLGNWSIDIIRHLHSQVAYTSVDELKPDLNGVFVSQNGTIQSCATDGHILRLIHDANINGKAKLKNKTSGIIPKKALQILSRTVKGKVKAAVSKTHLRIMLGEKLEFYVRLVDGNYPDFESVIPKEFQGSVSLDNRTFKTLIRDAKPFVNRETKQGAFAIGESSVDVTIKDPEEDISWDSTLPVIDRDGENLKIGLNVHLLEKALKGINEAEIKWEYNTPVSASILSGANGSVPNIIHLLMPMRLEEEKNDE